MSAVIVAEEASAREAERVDERPYSWVHPALPAEVERVVAALHTRQWERRSRWAGRWTRLAAGRLRPLDREMAAVRELRELATAVLDRRGGNRYGTMVPVSEVLLLLEDDAAWPELLDLAGVHPAPTPTSRTPISPLPTSRTPASRTPASPLPTSRTPASPLPTSSR